MAKKKKENQEFDRLEIEASDEAMDYWYGLERLILEQMAEERGFPLDDPELQDAPEHKETLNMLLHSASAILVYQIEIDELQPYLQKELDKAAEAEKKEFEERGYYLGIANVNGYTIEVFRDVGYSFDDEGKLSFSLPAHLQKMLDAARAEKKVIDRIRQTSFLPVDKMTADGFSVDFFRQHETAISVLYGKGYERKRNAFFDSLTIEEIRKIVKGDPPEKLLNALETKARTPSEYKEKLEAIYSVFKPETLIKIYERFHPQGTRIMPTSPTTHYFSKLVSAIVVSGQLPKGAKYELSDTDNSVKITFKSETDTVIFTLRDKTLILAALEQGKGKNSWNDRKNRDLRKMFIYLMIACNEQNFKNPVTIDIHELVKLGMYSDYISARKGLKHYMPIIFNGFDYTATAIRGGKTKTSGIAGGHGFISNYCLKPGSSFMTINIDPNFNIDILTEFFTPLPEWALSLKSNAFQLVEYIFFAARQKQNAASIKKSSCFNINLDTLRDNMGFPAYCGRDDYSRIKRPILAALDEVEAAIDKADDQDIKITPMISEGDITTAKIQEWLFNGYLQIEFSGKYAEYFSGRAKARAKRIGEAVQKAERRGGKKAKSK